MSKNLLYALSALLLFTGCKRDESVLNKPCITGCAVFNVHVTTKDNITPAIGVNVHMIWQAPPDDLFGRPSIDVANGYTDANGMFNIKFKADNNEFVNGSFTITATGPTDYLVSNRQLFGIHNPDTTLNTSVHLPAKANMRIVFKNFDPQTSVDVFQVLPSFDMYGSNINDILGATSPARDNGSYTNNLFYTNTSAAFDSLVYTAVTAGNQYTYFQVWIKRNGVRIDHTDSLYIPKGAVGTYRVDYQHSFQ